MISNLEFDTQPNYQSIVRVESRLRMQDLSTFFSHAPSLKKLLEDVFYHNEDAKSRKRKIKDLGNRYPVQERGKEKSQDNSCAADLRETQPDRDMVTPRAKNYSEKKI